MSRMETSALDAILEAVIRRAISVLGGEEPSQDDYALAGPSKGD